MTQPAAAAASAVRPIWLPCPEEVDAARSDVFCFPLSYDPLTTEEREWLAEADEAARELPEELAIR